MGDRLTWRRFADLVTGLLACNSRIARQMNLETSKEEVRDDE